MNQTMMENEGKGGEKNPFKRKKRSAKLNDEYSPKVIDRNKFNNT